MSEIHSKNSAENAKGFIQLLRGAIDELQAIRTQMQNFLGEHPELLYPEQTGHLQEIPQKERLATYSALRVILKKLFACIARVRDGAGNEYSKTVEGGMGFDTAHFTHNLGIDPMHIFGGEVTNFLYRQHVSDGFFYSLQNFDSFIGQTIAHFQSFIKLAEGKRGVALDTGCSMLGEAVEIVLRSRAFVSETLALKNDPLAPKGLPLATFWCDAGLEVPIPLDELIEMIYYTVSNADRILGKELEKGKNPQDLVIEVKANQVIFKDKKVVTVEIYNSGRHIDITALEKKISKWQNMEKLPTVVRRVVNAQRRGSRQASVSAVMDPALLLFIDGLTHGTGGTGMGLTELLRHTDLRGGVVMINNVFGETPRDNGVCVTLLFPAADQGGGGVDAEEMKAVLSRLKDSLQSGGGILSEMVDPEVRVA